jgi:hypothetical protein
VPAGTAPLELRQARVDVRHVLAGVARNPHGCPVVPVVHHAQVAGASAPATHHEVVGLLRSTPELDGRISSAYPYEDEQSVVDSELRVRGLDGLRVADASVMPSLPPMDGGAALYAIAWDFGPAPAALWPGIEGRLARRNMDALYTAVIAWPARTGCEHDRTGAAHQSLRKRRSWEAAR